MISKHPFCWKIPNRRGGFALILVVLSLVLMVILAVSMLSGMGTELAAARTYADSLRVRQLAAMAEHLGASLIQTGSTPAPGHSWASQPGMIRHYDSQGRPAGFVRLYSWDRLVSSGPINPFDPAEQVPATWWQQPARFTDLNEPIAGRHPIADPAALDSQPGAGSLSPGSIDEFRLENPPLATGAARNELPMPVQWLYVLQDGSLVLPSSVSGSRATIPGASATNPIIGRIAFWADDETAKVNLNTAAEGVYWDFPRGTTPTSTGNHMTLTTRGAEVNLANRRPMLHEFQRYPGHPAQTSLSAVLGAWMAAPVEGTGYDAGTVANWNALLPLYALTPRTTDGGSRGGTVVTANPASPQTMPRKTERFYASPHELLFTPTRSRNLATPTTPLPTEAVSRLAFFTTTHSRAPETNLFGRPRITLWPLSATETRNGHPALTAADRLIKFCSTINGHLYAFQRQNSQSPTDDYLLIPRNQQLLAYLRQILSRPIPGFGSSFTAKYGSADCDQLLTSIFDYVRSSNLNDPDIVAYDSRGVPLPKSYAAYTEPLPNLTTSAGIEMAFGTQPSNAGQVIPIRITHPSGSPTKGPGRFPVIDSAALVFYCTDRTWTSPVKDPTTRAEIRTQIKAALLVSWVHPMDGYMRVMNRFRVEIEGNPQTLITPSGAISSPPQTLRFFPPGGARMIVQPPRGFNMLGMGTLQSIAPWTMWKSIQKSFSNPSERENAFEVTTPVPITLVGDPASDRSSFSFSQTSFTLRLFGLNQPSTDTPIQTVTLQFPPADNLPIPGPWIDWENRFANPPTMRGYYFPDFTYEGGDTAISVRRKPWSNEGAIVARRPPRNREAAEAIIQGDLHNDNEDGTTPGQPQYYGDVVRSLQLVHGDFRLLTSRTSLGPETYVPAAGYSLPSRNDPLGRALVHVFRDSQGHNVKMRHNFLHASSSGIPAGQPGRFLDLNLPNWTDQDHRGALLPPEIRGLRRVPGWNLDTPGDWTTTSGNLLDGAFFSRGDEGAFGFDNQAPYYSNQSAVISPNITSPFLQIPSPVVLGAIPSQAASGRPWQTLLFRPPHTPTGIPHPGAASPPDHLLLDLFTMPQVEPWAISEPFSTAGKINLNHHLIPFSYIKRDSALRALLANERLTAIPNDHPGYKYGTRPPTRIRFPINLDQTLAQLSERYLSSGDLFRSPSQICDIPLVPLLPGITNSNLNPQFWDRHLFTGDNLKERPYASIYPRLTTQSNSFRLHYRVQSLHQPPLADPTVFDPSLGSRVSAEFRASRLLERYLDPNDPSLPDFSQLNSSPSLYPFYRLRYPSTSQVR